MTNYAESLSIAPALRQLAREAATSMSASKRREHTALSIFLLLGL